jgi:DNA-binding transcriptional LysR family regulator
MTSPLDSRQLRAFCVLARTGSFTETGRELHLTPSSISHAMKALERDVGCQLLDRSAKRVLLTQAGEQLLHHASRILKSMEDARASLKQLGKWGRGRLRLGASTTACQHFLPPVLRELKDQFPKHSISIEPGDAPSLVTALLRHRIDLALAPEPGSDPQLRYRRLFVDELKFIVGPLHPWARQRRVERSEIPRQNYILYSKQSVTFRLIEDYFRREQMVLNTVMELGSMEATRELVKLGLGVSIVAPWIAQRELAEGTLVSLPLGRRRLRRPWCIMHLHGRRLDLAEEAFIGLCESATADLVANSESEARDATAND